MGSIHCSTCCECSISGPQVRPTESPTAAAGDDDERENTTPDNQHLLDVTDSPPSSAHSHPSPLALNASHPHSEPIAMGSRSKSMSSWRRSPSYEKLQEFVLPSVQEGGVASGEGGVEAESSLERLRRPSHQSLVVLRTGGGKGEGLLSPNRRRRQTLSMSGSAYSVESSGQSYASVTGEDRDKEGKIEAVIDRTDAD